MSFVFYIKSPPKSLQISKILHSWFTSIFKNVANAEERVRRIGDSSFEEKLGFFKDHVFNFIIPYLLFLFTPVKFFKKNGKKFDFHYLLNENNNYFEFDFIKVENDHFFFKKDDNRINVNINSELALRYENLIEYFSKNNIFVLIFASWYCTVMDDKDKKQYIENGSVYNLFTSQSESMKNFNSLIAIIEGENNKMSKQNIFNIIKKCLKIVAFLNVNAVWSLPTNKINSEEKEMNSEEKPYSMILNDNDKLLIDLVFEKFKKGFTDPVLENLKKAFLSGQKWVSDDLQIKELVTTATNFFNENAEDLKTGLKNLKKTNRFLEDFRLRLIFFYCLWNYNENFSLNFSFGGDFSPKKYKTTALMGIGVDVENFSLLNNFYIDSISVSVLAYSFDFSEKDFVFNGLSCLIFPSFFSLKNFKLFVGIRLHEHISFLVGAAYVHKKQSL